MKAFKREAYGYIKDMFIQHNMVKRTVLSLISVLITGFAVSLFSLFRIRRVDPFTSMNMNVSSVVGIGYGTLSADDQYGYSDLCCNRCAPRARWSRHGIQHDIGGVTPASFFEKLFLSPRKQQPSGKAFDSRCRNRCNVLFKQPVFYGKCGALGPYDTLAFMLTRSTKIPMKWTRVMTDVSVVSDRSCCKRRIDGAVPRKLFRKSKISG